MNQLQQSCLRFSPTAWAKLLYLRDFGRTEVGGFAIATSEDHLLVNDIQLVRQATTVVTVDFDDQAVAEFFDQQVDLGLKPAQFARIWVHTHPGRSAQPSVTDEETFARAFGRTEWSVMFILAKGGQTYCQLQFNVGPGGAIELPVEVDYAQPFPGSDQAAWRAEYLANVEEILIAAVPDKAPHDPGQPFIPGDSATHSDDWSVAPVEEDWYDLILGQY